MYICVQVYVHVVTCSYSYEGNLYLMNIINEHGNSCYPSFTTSRRLMYLVWFERLWQWWPLPSALMNMLIQCAKSFIWRVNIWTLTHTHTHTSTHTHTPRWCHHAGGVPPLWVSVHPCSLHHIHCPHTHWAAHGGTQDTHLALLHGPHWATQCRSLCPLSHHSQGLFRYVKNFYTVLPGTSTIMYIDSKVRVQFSWEW